MLKQKLKKKAMNSFETAKERAEINRPDDDKVFELIDKGQKQIEDEEWFELVNTVQEIEKHLED